MDTLAKRYDFLIIGSGFGGAVTAMRLAQKGYSVAVLEKGRRFGRLDFGKTNWNLPKYFWAPFFRCFGIQQISLLKGVMVLHGSGVGGGSLVYANTLMEPRPQAFKTGAWPAGLDWATELKPYYQLAKKMLGVTENKLEAAADQELRKLGEKLGVGSSYHLTEVGVFFGKQGVEVPDPYFSGTGPARVGCTGCGGCMVGCRVGAKNTLDQNYLYFAEKWGTQIFPQHSVSRIEAMEKGFQVQARVDLGWWRSHTVTFQTDNVVFSAGVIGTLKLLFQQKEVLKTLPLISGMLGQQVRTNGESLCGATSFETHRDLSRGIAIGSAIHLDDATKIEPVRYSSGSSSLRLLTVPLTEDGSWLTRPLKLLKNLVFQLPAFIRTILVKNWARQTIILLVMQSLDQKMRLRLGRSILTLGRKGLVGDTGSEQVPSFIPVAQKASELLAEQIEGAPQNCISEVLLGTPATAHILGGAVISHSAHEGVINLQHEIHGYRGLFVCDGSVIPGNLGVNPSLTITAMAERFVSQFPTKTDSKINPPIKFSADSK